MKRFAVTGIGTDVGKTVVSAILVEALKANYWKPIQAGDLNNSDSMKMATYCPNATVLNEAFRLTQPMSPHAAAQIDRVDIELSQLQIPEIKGNLIIEGAGGIMVPINQNGLTFCDVMASWKIPVVIVSKHYLGSINHTLMTAEVLKSRGIEVKGIIFVGDENKNTEEIILKITQLDFIARIPWSDNVDRPFIIEQAKRLMDTHLFTENA